MSWFEIQNPKRFYDEMQEIKSMLLNKIIPDVYPYNISGFFPCNSQIYVNRYHFINISAFALISKVWLKPLAEYIGTGKCLEIMAGRGILSKGLSDYGVDIIATDNFSWEWRRGKEQDRTKLESYDLWFEVENLDCIDAIEKYGSQVSYILCSWPYMDTCMYRSLVKMREINPECKLIYIGEGNGGCTADDEFFSTVKFIEEGGLFNQAASKFQSWWGIYDELRIAM